MLRPLVSYLFIISILFLSVEGAVVPVADGHQHGDTSAHLTDSDHSTSTDSEDNCQHSCHNHTSCFSQQLIAISDNIISQQFSFYDLQVTNLAQAPPTPPPNV